MNNHGLSGNEMVADDLTWREQDILILLAEHLTNREIANRLHLAESTVKDYVGKILGKLYVKNRRQAVERAKALGLLDPERETETRPKAHLPAAPTPFVGRREELAEVKRHLGGTRLLTLTGPGGIGKTRLALETAKETAGDFEDGCFFVSLAKIRSTAHIVQTIAEGLRFPLATHEDPQHQLLRYLRKRRLLLVMDNFEHLLDGAGIASAILQVAPAVKILATSREKLNLQSETNYILQGMGLPCQEGPEDILKFDAIALFVQSASKVCPGFNPSPEELKQIAKICQMVGGMPLAIELAAAWLQILNVDEVSEELEKGLDILSAEVRDAPERHQSIRAVFDYSWDLMDQTEQENFKILSVFRGGFTREAARQVSGASLQQLAGFVNKSLLNHDPGSGRLEIHELLRQYAQERLEGIPLISFFAHEAHAAYYAAFMQQRWEDIRGPGQMRALAEIETDIENVRAAWRHSLEQLNAPQLWQFIKGLWYVYWIRWWNHAGMELFAEAVSALRGTDNKEILALRALSKAFQGFFMAWLDLSDRGYELAKGGIEILRRLDHPEALAFAYYSLAVNAYFQNRFKGEIKAINKMIEIASKTEDKWLLAFTLFPGSLGVLIEEDYTEAERLAKYNLALYKEIGDVIGSTMPLIVLGHSALARGAHEEARLFYLRCLKIGEETGFYYAIQTATKYLGKVEISMGKIEEAELHLIQSLEITKEIGFVRDIINLISEFARLQVAQGHPQRATELLALVLQHPTSSQTRLVEGPIGDSVKDLLAWLEEELSQDAFAAALDCGQELELDEVVENLVALKSRE